MQRGDEVVMPLPVLVIDGDAAVEQELAECGGVERLGESLTENRVSA
jgi:hypothetical protein